MKDGQDHCKNKVNEVRPKILYVERDDDDDDIVIVWWGVHIWGPNTYFLSKKHPLKQLGIGFSVGGQRPSDFSMGCIKS